MSLLILFFTLTTPPPPQEEVGNLEGVGTITSSLEPVGGFAEA